MISDDHVNPDRLCVAHNLKCSNACVDADDEPYAPFGCLFDHVGLHTVAFFQAMRYVEIRDASEDLNRLFENYDRGRSIYVIVPVD